MTTWAMVIDLDKCIGCQSCTAACRAENNVPFAGPEQAEQGRAIFWHEVLFRIEGEYPHVSATIIPRPCFHCENPPCVKVCPVGATYKREEDGLVLQRYERCIGCRYCAVACPYGVRYFRWYDEEWPAIKTLMFPCGPRASWRSALSVLTAWRRDYQSQPATRPVRRELATLVTWMIPPARFHDWLAAPGPSGCWKIWAQSQMSST
jgi:Fe-S-cluster-containing hydrogenase component 2